MIEGNIEQALCALFLCQSTDYHKSIRYKYVDFSDLQQFTRVGILGYVVNFVCVVQEMVFAF